MLRSARLTLALFACALGVAGSLGAGSAAAATLSLSVVNAKTTVGPAGTPMSASGTVDADSVNGASVRVFTEDLSTAAGPACAPTSSEEQVRGDAVQQPGSTTLAPGDFSVQLKIAFFKPGRYRVCGYVDYQGQTRAAASVDPVTVADGSPPPACPDSTFTIVGPPVLSPAIRGVVDVIADLKVRLPGPGTITVSYYGRGLGPDDTSGLNLSGKVDVPAAGVADIKLSDAFSFDDGLDARKQAVTKKYVLVFQPEFFHACLLPNGSQVDSAPKSAPQSVEVTTLVPGGAGALPSGVVPTGKAAKIGAILKAGAYSPTVTIKTAGKLRVVWYLVPKGAKTSAAKPVIVASGTKTVKKAGKTKINIALTKKGRALLKSSKKVKITAKGTFDPSGKPKPVAATTSFTLAR